MEELAQEEVWTQIHTMTEQDLDDMYYEHLGESEEKEVA